MKHVHPWEISPGFAQRRDCDGKQAAYVLTEGDGWQWYTADDSGEVETCADAMRAADAALDAAGYLTSIGGSVLGQVDKVIAQLGAKP